MALPDGVALSCRSRGRVMSVSWGDPDKELGLFALAVGVLRGGEATGRISHLAHYIVQNLLCDGSEEGLAGHLPGVQVHPRQLGVAVEHLHPLPVGIVTRSFSPLPSRTMIARLEVGSTAYFTSSRFACCSFRCIIFSCNSGSRIERFYVRYRNDGERRIPYS
jgi:hypothetical protein